MSCTADVDLTVDESMFSVISMHCDWFDSSCVFVVMQKCTRVSISNSWHYEKC